MNGQPGPDTILFATIAAGGGHLATARAMAEAVEALDAGYRTRVSDVMAEYGAAGLDRRHKRSWRWLLGRPRLLRLAQRLLDAAPRLTRTVHEWFLDGFARQVARRLNGAPPKLVVVNHGWLATAFTMARLRHGLAAPVVVFATEPFDASALWSTPAAELVLAPSAAARDDLLALGVPPRNVLVSGYPVGQRFLAAIDAAAARAHLGLSDTFTCLLSIGAEGVADPALVEAVFELAAGGVQVLCAAGRNQELLHRLEQAAKALPPSATGSIVSYGYTESMELLLAAADLVVGKAGPASTMEALAVGRPLLVTAFAGYNEQAVLRFLQSRQLGAGRLAAGGAGAGWAGLSGEVEAWRADLSRLEVAKRSLAELDFAGMTRGIADFLVAYADSADAQAAASWLKPGAFASVGAAEVGRGAGPRAVAG